MFISLNWSDISSILLKRHFLHENTFESIVLKTGACLITPDELIIWQIYFCEANNLLLVYLDMFKI